MQNDKIYLATAHWCGHCTEQKAIIKQHDELKSNIEVVECAKKDEKGNEYPPSELRDAVCGNVTGFPSWVKNGEVVKIGGGMSKDAICSNEKLLANKCD